MRAVVFDFDGTLAETRDAVADTVRAVLVEAGLPRVAPAWVHTMMGLPLTTLLRKAVPRTIDVDVEALAAAYRARFTEIGGPQVRPMPGATALLDALAARGVACGIATSREASTLGPILDAFGWADRFGARATCDRVAAGKPAPDLLTLALAELGVSPAGAVLVGDTRWDIAMAQAAGVCAVGVSHGSHGAEALREAGAAAVVDDLAALGDWLASRSGDGG